MYCCTIRSALFAFEENNVVIPLAVIEEIDNQKKRQDEIGRNARLVSQELDKMRARGRLASGVRLPSKGTLRIEVNHQDMIDFPAGLDVRSMTIASLPWSSI